MRPIDWNGHVPATDPIEENTRAREENTKALLKLTEVLEKLSREAREDLGRTA